MMDLQFKLAGGILCLIVLISSLTSGAGGAPQLGEVDAEVEVDFSKMPECSSKLCVQYAPSLPSFSWFTRYYCAFDLAPDDLMKLNRLFRPMLGCGTRIMTDCFCGKPNPLVCAWK